MSTLQTWTKFIGKYRFLSKFHHNIQVIPHRVHKLSITIYTISQLEVISAINKIESKTSYGCDWISNRLLKLIKNESASQ